ncbi:S-methyl-5-thioribose kinase [Pseudooceanicola aestuarii]|uniref:S-methyl-5-thioribose kinase n=1 Tax=Pseudooceanicola aestuarii TaxID=2697319 RepID=UPI0013D26A0A|nr:S-methyl-5-thioribose kinase [Pseudooceanicola aestuarii]
MTAKDAYEPLTAETLGARLAGIDLLAGKVGPDPTQWDVQEVGDGNLNLVFIVKGPQGAAIVKQALPYVRLVGDSWPLPLYRAFYEYHALTREAARDPGAVPEVWHFDETQALVVMEFLSPHRILRQKLIAGERVDGLAERLGLFCARTGFRGSELSMKSADKKADVGLFSGNVEIPAITEGLVFTDPYFEAELNNHTPGLDPVIKILRDDPALKARAQRMLLKFSANTETLLHGDLHSGSVMATEDDVRVIDPEFAQYGPLGFDIGMLTANYLMAYFSQPGHRGDDLAAYQDWLLEVIEGTFAAYEAEFTRLWDNERTGMLYPAALFEDQGHSSAAARTELLAEIWQDAVSICGIEMHRRCLSLAHNADFEEIADPAIRAPLEARNLMMGRDLILNAAKIDSPRALTDLARQHNGKDVL